MMSSWFAEYIYSGEIYLTFGYFQILIFPYRLFGVIMFPLFLWASFHLITDIIMAFRAVFGFGYKKRKGGSH